MTKRRCICFLILHYGEDQMTYEAIKSILQMNCNIAVEIIIVDNGMGFKNIFEEHCNIHIVNAEQNLGFSKGNNLGYYFIKERFDPEFVIVMNNDIVFTDINFVHKLYTLYKETPFYVAGPDIYIPYWNYHSSPLYLDVPTRCEIEEFIAKCEDVISRNSAFSIRNYIDYIKTQLGTFSWYASIKNKTRKYQKPNVEKWDVEQSNVVLQGACIILDERFVKENSMIFFPETFLWMEESLLTLRCRKKSWNIMYFPQLKVNHLEHGSMKHKRTSYKEFSQKNIDRSKAQIASRRIYLEQLDESK